LEEAGAAPAAAPAPPPPDPAVIAAQAAAAEKAKKEDEKTAKQVKEEARKHAKREAWRARNKKKLDDIRKEADVKIASEAATKKKAKDTSLEAEHEGDAKTAQIQKEVADVKAAAMKKTAGLLKKNADTKAKMLGDISAFKAKAKAEDGQVIETVQAEIDAEKAKAKAKAALKLAEIKKSADDEQGKIKAKLDDAETKIANDELDAEATRTKAKADEAAHAAKLQAENDADIAALKQRDEDFIASATKKLSAKELKHKAESKARTDKFVAEAQKHSPGARKVNRLERRQDRASTQLVRTATREMRRNLVNQKAGFRKITDTTKQDFKDYVNQGAEAMGQLRGAIEAEDAPAANSLVASAWGMAVGDAPTKGEAEALTIARGGVDDLVPGGKGGPERHVKEAWSNVFNRQPIQNPEEKGLSPVNNRMRAAYTKALGLDASNQEREALKNKVKRAWAGVLQGKNAEREASSLPSAMGFNSVTSLDMTTPPAQDQQDLGITSKGVAPKLNDVLEVAIASEDALDTLPSSRLSELHDEVPTSSQEELPGADPASAARDAVKAILRRQHIPKKSKAEIEIETVKAQLDGLKIKKPKRVMVPQVKDKVSKQAIEEAMDKYYGSDKGHEGPIKTSGIIRSADAVVPEGTEDIVELAVGSTSTSHLHSGVAGMQGRWCNAFSTLVVVCGVALGHVQLSFT